MSTDAVFIVDEEFTGFDSVWSELQKLSREIAGSQAGRLEPLRFTLKNGPANEWAKSQQADLVGWHFSGEPTPEYFSALLGQCDLLLTREVPFRIRAQSHGHAGVIELRGSPTEKPYIAIPFEDDVKYAPRFFPRYKSALASGMQISEKKTEDLLTEFFLHCAGHIQNETPFDVSPASGLLSLKKDAPLFQWTPKRGTVGRHEIMQEMQISQIEGTMDRLLPVLAALYGMDTSRPTQLFLQFFAERDAVPEITIPTSCLYDMTFTYRELAYSEAERIIGKLLENPEVRSSITDTFTLLEQKEASIDGACSVTYTLRRTRTGPYEIRLNVTWESDGIDPEQAVAGLEKKLGYTWSRIV